MTRPFLLLILLTLAAPVLSLSQTTNTLHPQPTVSVNGGGRSISFDSTGKLIAACHDKTAIIWDVRTGLELRSFVGHKTKIVSVFFGKDDDTLITGSEDGVINFWSIETGKILRSIQSRETDSGEVRAFALNGDGRVLASANIGGTAFDAPVNKIRLWDANSGFLIKVIETPDDFPRALAFSPDHEDLAVGFSSNKLKIFNSKTGRFTREVDTKRQKSENTLEIGISSVSFSPDGRFLASGDGDGTINVLNAKTAAPLYVFKHVANVSCIVFSPDGKTLASTNPYEGVGEAVSYRYIKLWSLETGRELKELEAGYSWGLAFSPDGRLLASDGITLREVATGKIARTIKVGAKRLYDMSFSSDGRTLFVGGPNDTPALFLDWQNLRLTTSPIKTNKDQTDFSSDLKLAVQASDSEDEFYLSDATTGKVIHVFNKLAIQVGIAPDGNSLASVAENNLTVWDVANKKEKFNIALGESEFCGIGFSPHSNLMFAKCTKTGKTKSILVELSTGKVIQTISDLGAFDEQVFSPDERLFAYRTQRGTKVISVRGGNTVFVTDNGNDLITTLAFSPNSKSLATAGKLLRLFDTSTGKELRTFSLPENYFFDAVFDSSGEVIATAGEDKAIRLWKASTGELLRTLTGHTAEVDRIAFTNEGSVLASMGRDARIKFWSVNDGRELASFIFTETGGFIAITPDNYYLATRDALSTVSFNVGKKVFPFGQFDLKYNRPDIVLERLGNKNQDLIAGYRRSYEKRLRRLGFTNEMLKDDLHLPEIEITTKEIPVTTKTDRINFSIRATDTGFTLDRLNVFVNSIPVYGSGGLSLRDKKTQTYQQDLNLQLSQGPNRVEVSTLNENGVESLRESFEITYDVEERKPDLFVLAVGVSDYSNEKFKLTYAAKDAQDLTDLFKANGTEYGNVYVQTILNAGATRDNIIKAKEWLRNSKVDDEVLVFVSGHGLRDANFDYYFATADVDFKSPSTRGLSYDALEDLLDTIPARKKVLLMDTCFAGEIDKDAVAIKTTSTNEGEKLVTHSFEKGSELVLMEKDATSVALDNLFAELRRGSGAFVIAASGGAEFALESSRWKNGAFTYTLKNGLVFALADKNRDGTVSVSELRDYVASEVPKLTNGRQRPVARRDNLEFDFALAKQSKLIRSMKHAGSVLSLAISPDAKMLATTSVDETVRLWSLIDGTQKRLLQEASPVLTNIKFQSDGRVTYVSNGNSLSSWNPVKDKTEFLPASKLSNLSAAAQSKKDKYVTNEINSFVVNRNGRLIASGGEDQKIFIFNTQTQRQEIALTGHMAWIISIAWSGNGKLLASADEKGVIKIWDADNWTEVRSIKAHTKIIDDIAFNPDGTVLASTGADGAIIFWNTQTGEPIRKLSFAGTKENSSRCIAFSPDGKLLATGHDDGILRFWDVQTGELVDAIAAHDGVINSLVFTPDGSVIITGGGDSSIKVWRSVR